MKFTIYNKFKTIIGFLLLFNLLVALPASASYQDSVVNNAQVDPAAAPGDQTQVDSVTVATDDASGDTTASAVVSDQRTSTGDEATTSVEADKQIDAQVYKDMTYYLMYFLLICIIVAVIGKIQHIYTLSRRITGKYNPLANNNLQATLLLVFLILFLAGVYYSYAVWGVWSWRDAVTEHGKDIDQMFIITLIITTFVMIVVHILLLVFAYLYRMRLNRKAYFYPHNDSIERLWTIVPAIVLTVLVLFGFFTWRKITNVPEELQDSALQVEVMGEQFMWTVRYPGADGVIGKRNYKLTTPTNPYGIDFTDKSAWDDVKGADIVLPVNQPVRFHIISKDIIHSFYIPDFRVQINAVPGMTNYFQFTPTTTTRDMRDKLNDQSYDYVMLCAKICGESHYNMQKKVVVVTEAEYKEWLAKQPKFFTEDLQKEYAQADNGEEVLNTASLN
ncbi:cytochrome c oxidase subunit II [Sphingobacterium sp. lm-10]|uniref:cytochrome c oxidase subunit II n=1 Tax=Sphingobacterium sp. lm-10 TaxID=2944904 RepID=UPI00201FC876|nr:cytochrome c oxidase subunit II [Sphingobacterium sp. lm-10]MCL7988725.1 cytochrome c oxidase subunit II [Sphingobacterium sp. lm-10]